MMKRVKVLSLAMLGMVSLSACGTGVNQPRQAGGITPYDPYGTGAGTGYSSGGYSSGYGQTGYDTPYGPISNLPTGTVTGRITDSLTNQGVPGVEVQITGVRPAVVAMSDAAGFFTLANAPQGRQVLMVTKPGYTSVVGNRNIVVDVTAGNTSQAPQVSIVPQRGGGSNSFLRAFDNFVYPRGLTIDKDNNLYVVDVVGKGGILGFDRAEIKKINSDGGLIMNFGANVLNSAGDFIQTDLFRFPQKATGVGVDVGGNVYLADTGNNLVRKYGPNGRFIANVKRNFKNPFDVAVLNTGDMVVSDPGNSRVTLLDSSMNIKQDTLGGSFPLNSDGVRGVAVDATNNIYTVDASAQGGAVVKKYDESGTRLLMKFGSIGGIEPGYFNNPTDLAIDNRNGDIYVVDSGNNRIQKFDSQGNYLSPDLGSFGSANGTFNTPWSIAIDNQGFLYVTDTKNRRIQKFMPGRFGEQF
jgi:hypothetical protein